MALDRGKMCDRCHVESLLNGAAAEHRETGRTAVHDVLMVAVDGKCVGCKRAGADMEDTGKKFAGDLVHIRKHQHQALAGSVGRTERTALERAVQCTGCAAFMLHLTDLYLLTENVLFTVGSPLIHHFSHDGGGSDGIDGCDFRKCVGSHCGGGVAVDCYFLECAHRSTLLKYMFVKHRGAEVP